MSPWGLCRTWIRHSWSLLSYVPVLHSPRSLLCFGPAHPAISPTHPRSSTQPYAFESIIGGPVSDWSWLKATLPSSCGSLNLCSASRHVPAAFLSSYPASLPLVEVILGHPPSPSPHTTAVVSALATAAAQPDWLSLEDIDVPIR